MLRQLRSVGSVLAALALVVVPATTAFAHADLVQTDLPGPSLPELPAQFVMTFSQELDTGTSVQLLGPSGAPLDGVTVAIDRPRLRRLIVTTPPGAQGPYTVAWTSVSAEDGHQQSSFFGLLAGGTPLGISEPIAGQPTSGPGDLDVRLTAAPDEQGVHRWSATVAGAATGSISRILFRFTPLSADLGTENLVAQLDPGSGAYTVAEPIALIGWWRVEVGVRREGVPDDVRVPFTFAARQS